MSHPSKSAPCPIRAIRLSQVIHLTGASRPTIWRWVKIDPGFPRPFHLSAGVTAWDEAEILSWLRAKKEQREHADA